MIVVRARPCLPGRFRSTVSPSRCEPSGCGANGCGPSGCGANGCGYEDGDIAAAGNCALARAVGASFSSTGPGSSGSGMVAEFLIGIGLPAGTGLSTGSTASGVAATLARLGVTTVTSPRSSVVASPSGSNPDIASRVSSRSAALAVGRSAGAFASIRAMTSHNPGGSPAMGCGASSICARSNPTGCGAENGGSPVSSSYSMIPAL